MTQEGKAKRYDEALEELRGLLECVREEKREILEEDITSIFPELQENEDERIRKGIIRNLQYLMDMSEGFVKEDLQERIAWLEKQGEQKSIEWSGKIGVKHADGKLKEMLDRKEHHAWSEKYIADVFEKVGLAKIVREQSNDALTIALQDAMIELSKVTLQPKSTAWSQEDKKTLERVIRCIENHDYMNVDDIHWLKSIKDRALPQPMQEWTAEDEEELKIALDTLVKAGQHSSAKWLKNVCLVPQNKWKPSGVQMTVLDDVITNGHLPNVNEKILKGLQEQLRKLK